MNRSFLAGKVVMACLILLMSGSAVAKGKTFGLVVKSMDDINFQEAWRGCHYEALADGNDCVIIGAHGPENARTQALSIKNAINSQTLSGLALSVTNSAHLADIVASTQLPVITFDSDFSTAFQRVRHSFVGMNNLDFGRQLGNMAKQWYPKGGTVCLMTSFHSPNLENRLTGIRQVLSGNDKYPDGRLLSGENGWFECDRSPWNSGDNSERALNEIRYTLSVLKPDVLISVGHWPLIRPDRYRDVVEPFAEDMMAGKVHVLVGVGKVEGLEALLEDNLVQGVVQVDFFNIGVMSYKAMRDLSNGEHVSELHYVPSVSLKAENN